MNSVAPVPPARTPINLSDVLSALSHALDFTGGYRPSFAPDAALQILCAESETGKICPGALAALQTCVMEESIAPIRDNNPLMRAAIVRQNSVACA